MKMDKSKLFLVKRENDLVKTTSYYQNGNIRDVGYFDLDDRRQGKWKEYYENGNLFCEGSFLNGKQNGKWYELYENGQLKRTGNQSDGKRNDEYKNITMKMDN